MAPDWKITLPHLLAVAVIALLISESAKLVFTAPRPCDGEPDCPVTYAFPSTHSATAFAFFTLAAFVYHPAWVLAAVPVAAQRVVAGVHSVPDVVAGSVLGMVLGAIAFKLHLQKKTI